MSTRILLLLSLLVSACTARPQGMATTPTFPAKAVGIANPSERTRAQPPPKTVGVVNLEAVRVDVVAGENGAYTVVYDARDLLDEGNDALMQRLYDRALSAYDHLIQDFSDSPLVVPALYNAALALEAKRDFAGAAARYRKLLATDKKESQDFVDAQYRLAAVLAETERYSDAVKVLEQVLARNDISPSDRIEALARLGYALLEDKDYVGAEEILRSALAYHRKVQGTHDLDGTYYVGMSQYYLAHIPHQQFMAIGLRLPEDQLNRDIEHKSELLLLAQDRYVKTVEYKNPYWATAAIFQIGSMYQEFWDRFMAVPIPPDLNAKEAEAYVKLVNKNPEIRSLLEKVLLYHQRNLKMAKNAHISSPWIVASRGAIKHAQAILVRQQAGKFIRPGKNAAMAAGTVSILDSKTANKAVSGSHEYIPARVEL